MDNDKPKILFVSDSGHDWVWSTTAKSLAYYLTPHYEIEVMKAEGFRENFQEICHTKAYDLIYFRGYANCYLRKESVDKLHIPWISCVTTGGARLDAKFNGVEHLAKTKYSKGIIVQNSLALKTAYRNGYDVVDLIPNGCEIHEFYPDYNRKNQHIVGLAANVSNNKADLKGRQYVIEACKKLGYEYREVTNELPLSAESMPEWYRGLDYYIQPSSAEGCSASVQEAMSSGLPVFIVSTVGYHGDQCHSVLDRSDGEVVFVERDTDDIVNAIKILENNPYLMEKLKENARKFSIQHQWKFMAVKFKKVFDRALNIKTVIDIPEEVEVEIEVEKQMTQANYLVVATKTFRTKNGKQFLKDTRHIIPDDMYQKIKKYCTVIEK